MSDYGKWQPIDENTPKDEWIYLCNMRGNKRAYLGHWLPYGMCDWWFIEDKFKARVDADPHTIANGWIRDFGGPTHWMPFDLPRPPSRTEGE